MRMRGIVLTVNRPKPLGKLQGCLAHMVGGRIVHEEFDQVRDYVADGGGENVIGTYTSEVI